MSCSPSQTPAAGPIQQIQRQRYGRKPREYNAEEQQSCEHCLNEIEPHGNNRYDSNQHPLPDLTATAHTASTHPFRLHPLDAIRRLPDAAASHFHFIFIVFY
jgi:hypothetical protein